MKANSTLSTEFVRNKIETLYNSMSPQYILSDLLVFFEQERVFEGQRIVDYYESPSNIFEIYQIPYKSWLQATGITKEVLAEKEKARKKLFCFGDKLQSILYQEDHILIVTCDEVVVPFKTN